MEDPPLSLQSECNEATEGSQDCVDVSESRRPRRRVRHGVGGSKHQGMGLNPNS